MVSRARRFWNGDNVWSWPYGELFAAPAVHHALKRECRGAVFVRSCYPLLPNREETNMNARGFVVLAGQGPGWNMEPDRVGTFKMESTETGGSAAVFEEITPPGTVTPYHLHHDSDEIIYVLSGQMTFK